MALTAQPVLLPLRGQRTCVRLLKQARISDMDATRYIFPALSYGKEFWPSPACYHSNGIGFAEWKLFDAGEVFGRMGFRQKAEEDAPPRPCGRLRNLAL
jgi:hypothetical protein